MQLKTPFFWKNINIISILLYPITFITCLINFFKSFTKNRKFNVKTICVGNIYLGGTGKTPLSIEINNILKKKFNSVFIKKKYDYQLDEQNLLKQNGKLICKNNRTLGLKEAIRKKYELAILDDGLQDKRIKYDISIACFNSTSKIGNGFLLPAGPLRENLSSLKNYDAIFLNGEKKDQNFINKIKNINFKIKIFQANYKILNLKKFNIKNKYLVFSGVGNPLEFEETLKKNKIKIFKHIIFPDHYNFNFTDIKKIKQKAKKENLKIITTEKDYMRLNKTDKININFIKVKLKVKNLKSFYKFLIRKL